MGERVGECCMLWRELDYIYLVLGDDMGVSYRGGDIRGAECSLHLHSWHIPIT